MFARAGILLRVVRQLDHQKGIFHLPDGGDLHPPAVYVGTTALPTVETFVATRVVDYTQQQFFFRAKGYGYAIGRIVMNEIGRPVQRVHNPAVGFVAVGRRAFLRNEPGFGQQCRECGNDLLFRFLVYIGYIVVRMFLFHALKAEVLPLFLQKSSCIHRDTSDFGGKLC